MHPHLDLYFFEASAYGLFSVAALAAVIGGTLLLARKRGFATKDALWMLLGMAAAAFVGARLLNLFVNHEWYREDWSRVYAFDFSGFSLYGGILSALAAGFLISRLRGIPLLRLADTTAPFVGLGIALMRVGCFLNGCCFGKETDLPWGVTYPPFSPAHQHQIAEHVLNSLAVDPVHPTQLYELAAALLASMIAVFFLKRRLPDGVAACAAMIYFSAFRLINMYFRDLPYAEAVTTIFYPAFYAGIILVGAIWLYLMIKRPRVVMV